MKPWIYGSLFFILVAAGVGAYHAGGPQAAAQAQEQGGPPPAMPVETAVVKAEPVQIWKTFSGRMEAVDYAEIRPQVSGTIKEIKFEDGQQVNKGDVLVVIDPRPYQAAVAQAEADLSAARNRAELADKELKRAEGLIGTQAISQRIYDERANEAKTAQAAVLAAEARLEQAQIDLDYAHVKAPITGRVSRAEITDGNLVEAGPGAPVLTSIVSSDGIYADFEVDENTYLSSIRTFARDRTSENSIPVRLSVHNGGTAAEGFIHSFDNRIDASSGTIRARAYFENSDGLLLPGMFVTVRMGTPDIREKILVDERAIGTNQDRKFVYVIDENSMSTYREIEIGDSIKGRRIVLAGLEGGERIIADGLIRIRPGMPVVDKQDMKPPPDQDASPKM